jgi:hypothetical protein
MAAEESGVYADTVFSVGFELEVGVLREEELVVIGRFEVMFCST